MEKRREPPYDRAFFEGLLQREVRLAFGACRGSDNYNHRDDPEHRFEPDRALPAEQSYRCRIVGTCEWGVKTYYKQCVYSPCRDWIIPFGAIEEVDLILPDPPPPSLSSEEISTLQRESKIKAIRVVAGGLLLLAIAVALLFLKKAGTITATWPIVLGVVAVFLMVVGTLRYRDSMNLP